MEMRVEKPLENTVYKTMNEPIGSLDATFVGISSTHTRIICLTITLFLAIKFSQQNRTKKRNLYTKFDSTALSKREKN